MIAIRPDWPFLGPFHRAFVQGDRYQTWRWRAWSVAIFAALTIVHTWPLITNPATLSRNDNLDTVFGQWTIAWVGHALLTDPMNLFDANIFHPEKGTLAFSEPLIVPALMGLPLQWLGASPVLVYNVLLLIGLTLTGLATYFVVVSFTGDRLAGVLGGTLFAYSTVHMTRLPHMQGIHLQWLPLALWAVDRLLTHGRTRDAVWLALTIVGAAYTSGYTAVLVLVAVIVAVGVRPDHWGGEFTRTRLPRLMLAAAMTFVLVLPMALVYQEVRDHHGFMRTTEHALSATPLSYLASAARPHFLTWSRDLYASTPATLFPGVVAIGLTLVALLNLRRLVADGRVRMLVAVGVAGFLLSLGPRTPVYEWAYYAFPPMQGWRAVSRFGELPVLACAMLGAWGLADLRRWFATRRWITAASLGAVVLASIDVLHAPISYVRYEGIPPIYRLIARDPDAVVVEIPFYGPEVFFANNVYMLNSTVHWRPLLNGYSSFAPQSFRDAADELRRFPTDSSIDLLYERGVGYVVVHAAGLSTEHWESIVQTLAARPDFRVLAFDHERGICLYRFLPEVYERRGSDRPGII